MYRLYTVHLFLCLEKVPCTCRTQRENNVLYFQFQLNLESWWINILQEKKAILGDATFYLIKSSWLFSCVQPSSPFF